MWCEKKNMMVDLAKDPVNFNTALVPCKGAACLRWVDSRYIHTCNKAHARVGISPVIISKKRNRGGQEHSGRWSQPGSILNVKFSETNLESMDYQSHPIERQKKLAVLIDADNAQASIIKNLLDEVAKYGVASVKRIYGNWTTSQLQPWKDVLLSNSIIPVQQFTYTTKKKCNGQCADHRCDGPAPCGKPGRLLPGIE